MKTEKKLKLAFYTAVFGIGVAACFPYRDPANALDTVQKTTALHDVQLKDERGWFDCGKGDIWKTRFTAKNDKGEQVDGVVCRGWFKGSTIRYR